jgi:hypothetical protein
MFIKTNSNNIIPIFVPSVNGEVGDNPKYVVAELLNLNQTYFHDNTLKLFICGKLELNNI